MNTDTAIRTARLSDPRVTFSTRKAVTDKQDRTVFVFGTFPDARDFYDSVIGHALSVGYPFPQDDGTVHVVTRTIP